MAISMLITQADGGDILASDWNAEFLNIINNALSLISPLTGDLAAGGNRITGLSAGSVSNASIQPTGDANTGPYFSAADTMDIAAGGVRAARFNTAAIGVNFLDVTPAAAGSGPVLLATGADAAVNANYDTKGTGIHVFKIGAVESARIASTTRISTYVIKTADQTLTQSNTTLQNVTDLSNAVAASTNYLVEVFLLLNAANVTSDFKFGWTVPASCTMLWGPLRTSDSTSYWIGTEPATDPIALLTNTSTFSVGSFSGTTGLFLNAIVRNSTNAGTLQLQASQDTSDPSDNKILKDSLMRVTKIQ